MSKLAANEALRLFILLDESLEKLDFLESVSVLESIPRNELAQSVGAEISRIIQEQKNYELEYESLVIERSKLRGLLHREKLAQVTKKMKETALKLREVNKTLCRNLKDRPKIKDSIDKLNTQRNALQDWYNELKNELLQSNTMITLQVNVHNRKEQDNELLLLKQRERELTNNIRILELKLKRAALDLDKSLRLADEELDINQKKLKTDTMKNNLLLSINSATFKGKESSTNRLLYDGESRLLKELRTKELQLKKLTHYYNIKAGVMEANLEIMNNNKVEIDHMTQQDVNDIEINADDNLKMLTKRLSALENGIEQERALLQKAQQEEEVEKQRAAFQGESEEKKKLAKKNILTAITFIQNVGRKYIEGLQVKKKKKSAGKKKK